MLEVIKLHIELFVNFENLIKEFEKFKDKKIENKNIYDIKQVNEKRNRKIK